MCLFVMKWHTNKTKKKKYETTIMNKTQTNELSKIFKNNRPHVHVPWLYMLYVCLIMCIHVMYMVYTKKNAYEMIRLHTN